MAFTVVYDANVLHPASLRDFLIRLASIGLLPVLDSIRSLVRSQARRASTEAAQRM